MKKQVDVMLSERRRPGPFGSTQPPIREVIVQIRSHESAALLLPEDAMKLRDELDLVIQELTHV